MVAKISWIRPVTFHLNISLADEYDAAQDRGEVASKGKPVNVLNQDIKATAQDIGLTRQQIHEARQSGYYASVSSSLRSILDKRSS